jgi:succinate dehydrogenase/fumarate reductase cytochrome b subunit
MGFQEKNTLESDFFIIFEIYHSISGCVLFVYFFFQIKPHLPSVLITGSIIGVIDQYQYNN